jgi:hypothetical protein
MSTSSLLSLRALLAVDAVTCAVMGAALALGAGPIAGLTEIPAPFLLYAGLALLPIAGFMAVSAMRSVVPGGAAWLVIAGNVAWIAASIAILLFGWVSPNMLGTGLILAQAVAVAALVALEHGALRSTTRPAGAH